MNHSVQISDDIYEELVHYAESHGQDSEALFMKLVKEGVEQLRQMDSMAAAREVFSGQVHDLIAPFVTGF